MKRQKAKQLWRTGTHFRNGNLTILFHELTNSYFIESSYVSYAVRIEFFSFKRV